MTKLDADTPVHRRDIREMSEDEVDAFILDLRERRKRPVRQFLEDQLLKKEAKAEAIREQLEKQLDMLQKDMERAERAVVKMEQRARKIRGLKLELDD